MKIKDYISPSIETILIVAEQPVLQTSGQFDNLESSGSTDPWEDEL